MGVCLRRYYLNIRIVGELVCSELGQGTTGCSVDCCLGVMYGEWYFVFGTLLCCRLLRYVLTMVV